MTTDFPGASKLLINEEPLQVLPTLAAKLGLHEAIILQQVHYWIRKSPHEHDGRKWIYNSYPAWAKQMPCFTEKQVRSAINHLEDAKLLLSRIDLNALKLDRTKWYTIDYDVLRKLDSTPIPQTGPPSAQTGAPSATARADHSTPQGRPIPETDTEREPEPASPSQTQEKRGDAPVPNTKAAQFRRWSHVPAIYRRYVDADTDDCTMTDTKLTWLFVDCHDAQVQAGKYSIQDVIDRIAELVKWSWTNPAVEDLMDARHEAYCADHRGYVRDMEAMKADMARVDAEHASRR